MSRRLAVFVCLLVVALLAVGAVAHERPYGRYHHSKKKDGGDGNGKGKYGRGLWRGHHESDSSRSEKWRRMELLSAAAAVEEVAAAEETVGEYQGAPETEEGEQKDKGWHRRRHDGGHGHGHNGKGKKGHWWRHHPKEKERREDDDGAAAAGLTAPKNAQCRLCVASVSQDTATGQAKPMKYCLTKQHGSGAAAPTDASGQCVPVDQDCAGGLDAEIRTLAQCPNDAPETKTSCSACTLDGYTWCSSGDDDDDDDDGKGRCVDRAAAAERWRARKERKEKKEKEDGEKKDGKEGKWHKKKGKHHHHRFCAKAVTLPQQCPTETAPNKGDNARDDSDGWRHGHSKGEKEKEKGKDKDHHHEMSDQDVEDAIGALVFFGLVACFAVFVVREARRRRRRQQQPQQQSFVPGAPGPFVAVAVHPQPGLPQQQQQQPQPLPANAVRVHVPVASAPSPVPAPAPAPIYYYGAGGQPQMPQQQQQAPMYYIYHHPQHPQQQQPVLIPVAHPVGAAAPQHHQAVEMHQVSPPPPTAPLAAVATALPSPVSAAVVASPVEGAAAAMYPSLGRNGYSRLPTNE